ncbi:MAG TPA: DUF378 domain-containing protein [Symbiobacteriaceae bacterium]|nr:DUF378 domain-containing protein [Symbiobacteriaceae bacterium]
MSIARWLTIIGAINWGLVGFFRFDLVAALFGGTYSFLARVIYAIIGIAGVMAIVGLTTGNRDRVRVD